MTRQEREALPQRICDFYIDSSNKSRKTTVKYFSKQGFPRRTIYNILNKYFKYGHTKFLPKSGRPLKISDQKLKQLVKSVNNRCGISQRKLAKRFNVNQSTISRNLRQRTAVVIRRRRKAPKMDSKMQERRSRRNCGRLYRMTLPNCELILDDEKYFTLTNADVGGNRFYYSTDPSTAPVDIKLKQKKKFEPKLMVWMALSAKDVSDVYIYKHNQAVRQEVYLNECIVKRLISFIRTHYQNQDFIFWTDMAKAHYSKIVQERLTEEEIPFVSYRDNPPNVPQARPIETLWSYLTRKVYENNGEAKNLTALESRIKRKIKEVDMTVLQTMVGDVRKKLRRMWRNGIYSVL